MFNSKNFGTEKMGPKNGARPQFEIVLIDYDVVLFNTAFPN
jgi:hypothetical protein